MISRAEQNGSVLILIPAVRHDKTVPNCILWCKEQINVFTAIQIGFHGATAALGFFP